MPLLGSVRGREEQEIYISACDEAAVGHYQMTFKSMRIDYLTPLLPQYQFKCEASEGKEHSTEKIKRPNRRVFWKGCSH
jgi:hypothetical protein